MLRNITANIVKCRKSIGNFSPAPQRQWDILAAVCIERNPVIVPEMDKMQKEYSKYLAEIELERSFKSNHEFQHEMDLKHNQLLKKGDIDVEVTLQQTAQDFADATLEELQKFKLAPKITEADESKNLQTPKRKLDKHLVLLTKQKIGEKSYFLLPQSPWKEGETLRETANRILKDDVDVDAMVYSNAPSGFYRYIYPKSVRSPNGSKGAKVFIYYARYKDGDVKKENLDYKWLDRNELKAALITDYHKSLSQMLIDE